MKKIGFIGLGIMGEPMAQNLLKARYDLTVYNRTRSQADNLAKAGTNVAASPREAAESNEMVITIVTDTPDVEQVIFDQNGIIEGCHPGLIVVDMSTISPGATQSFSQRLLEKNVTLLDAPVSGGDIGARDGTLTIMVGGDGELGTQALIKIYERLGNFRMNQ